MIKPSKKACDAVQKSREICNILCRGSAGYGREAVMSFIRARIKEFVMNYFYEKNCNEHSPFNIVVDDDTCNEDVYVVLPYCCIYWLTANGDVRVVFHDEKAVRQFGKKADVEYINNDAFRLFYDFDANKNYKDEENVFDEEYFNKYYKNSPEQIYDYLQTITCKRIIDIIKNFYDKRLVKCNKIEPLEGIDFITVEEK